LAEDLRAQQDGRRHRQAQGHGEVKSGVQEAADRDIPRRGGNSFIPPGAAPRHASEPPVVVPALQHRAGGRQHEDAQEEQAEGKPGEPIAGGGEPDEADEAAEAARRI